MKINDVEYKTIWFDEEKQIVKIIDQTKLPHKFIIKELSSVKDAIDAIKTMEVRGAPLIGGTAAFGLVLAIKENIPYQRGGTYVVMEGPQFSTLAESNLYRSWKVDVIGMTNMPEAKLAREAEIRYASVSMVTDYDCWHPDHENVDVQQVIKVLLDNAAKAKNMIKNLIDNFENHIDPNDPTNNCLDVAIITAPEKRTQKTKDKLKTIAGRVLNR